MNAMTTPRSLYFGPPGHESLAWVHGIARPARRGVVICSSFGREDLCIHRSLKHIAQHAAAQGLPALRFDYPGSGDSAGGEFDGDAVARWLASVHDAIDSLKLETGVSEVCLVGVRLGSLLAACVARERADVAGLVAIAPVTAGRLFVREMKAYSLGATSMGLKVPRERTDGLLEAGGFAMDWPTQEGLKALDLLKQTSAPAHPTLIIERDDLPADMRWLKHLHALGAEATSLRIPGYAGMVRDSSPHHCEVPAAIIDTIVPWMAQRAPLTQAVPTAAAQAATVDRATVLRCMSPAGTPILEQLTHIDAGARLTALITAPALPSDAEPRRAVVLLSGGTDRRIGPGRLFVQLAREWAGRGVVVLRLDPSGIGDSEPRAGFAENLPYLRNALDDIDAAVRHLREHHRAANVQLIGLCAGAYNALRAAVETVAVDAVVMINPLLFLSVGDTPVDLVERKAVVVDSVRGYKRHLFDRARWQALLSDPLKIARVLRNLVMLVGGKAANRWHDLQRVMGIHLHNDFPSELLQLARRQTHVRFVFSDDEHGETLLWSLGGATVKRLRRRGWLSIHYARGADHLFTLQDDRQALCRQLTGLVLGTEQAAECSTASSQPAGGVFGISNRLA
jgi:alpha-beta hydrolase superfamily lysophospholipase